MARAPTPPPRPLAPAFEPHIGMSTTALTQWADRAGVSDLLALPPSIVGDPGAQSWLNGTSGYGWTLARLLVATPSRYESSWSFEPPRKVIERAIAFLVAAAAETANAVAPPRPPAAEPRLVPVAARVDKALTAMAKLVGPPLVRPSFVASFLGPDAVLKLTAQGPTGCQPRAGTFTVNLEAPAAGPMVTCSCSNPPPACRARLHALRWVRAGLSDPSWPVGAEVAERVATPIWQRTLSVLGSSVPKETEGELGWAIDLRRGVQVKALLCRRTKSGTLKTAYLDKSDLPAQARRGDLLAADSLLLELLPALAGTFGSGSMLYTALRTLVAHPRVFDAETRLPFPVHLAPIRARLWSEEGDVRVQFEVGDEVYSARDFLALLAGDGRNRILRRRPDALLLSEATQATVELANVLYHRGDSFGLDAVPELLRHLASIKLGVHVDPEIGVLRRKGDVRPVVRLESGNAPILRIQVRSRPHPSVGMVRPGETATGLVGREGTTWLMIDRDAAGELLAAKALTSRLGLTAEPEWNWAVDDPEEAIRIVLALRETPDALVEWGGRRPEVRDATGKNVRVEIGRGTDWFGVGGALDVAGAKVPLVALLEAMRSGRSWVRAEGDVWVRVEERLRERLRALSDATDAQGRIAPIHAGAIQSLEDEGVEVDAPPIWVKGMDRMRTAAHLSPEVPASLRATLRPYQVEGHAWITRLLHWAGGAVLADDMGLGKTVQALAVMLDRAEGGPQLVVAPMSVGFNWLREAERFAPSLTTHLHHGTSRPQDLAHLKPGDLLITTWDILVRDEALRALPWATVVFDEAQAMKNSDTLRAKAAAAVKADARLALTGTPIENRLSELWSLLTVVVPGLLGSAPTFRQRFAGPIERDADVERRQALARIVRPFLLRRMKGEVERDLPRRTEIRVDVELEPHERRRYDELRAATLHALTDDTGPREQMRFRVLAALTRLRQIACASRLVDDAAPARSAKIDRLLELLTELREEGRRVLVFSQFAELIRHVRPLVEAEGLRTCHLDGATPAAQRRAEVDRFQAGDADVFLISLKAGGTGLNLTAASEVVLLDPWWNPAVEDQAADRAHRIGQTKAVTVYRLVARDTVEDGILALHARKRDLAGAVLEGTGEAGALSVEDLVALMSGEERPLRRPSGRTPAKAATAAKAAKPAKPAPAPVPVDLAVFERALLDRFHAGELSRATVSNTVNPLRRLQAWSGSLDNVEVRLSEWRDATLDIPPSDRSLVAPALRRLRAWEAGT